MVGVGRELKDHLVLTPCPGQGRFAPDQGAPRHVQTALEEFQGWSKVRTQSHSTSTLGPSCHLQKFLAKFRGSLYLGSQSRVRMGERAV